MDLARLVPLGPALAFAVILAASCAASRSAPRPIPASAPVPPETSGQEGEARGFPELRVLGDGTRADGEFTQWLEGDRLHIRIRYDFGGSHWIEERAVLRQEPQLLQERWSWEETKGGSLERRFALDFLAGRATAEKREGDEHRSWSEDVDLQPGRAFAGTAWALAIKSVRARLVRGEAIEFQTVGFTPKPRAATVEITHEGVESLSMSERTIPGDRFRLHPKVPWFLRPFVDAPDSVMWLTNPLPAAFLRFEGPLAEPSDPPVRVDLLPG